MDAKLENLNSQATLPDSFVRLRGAREHNLKDVSLEIHRNALVVFTGVSIR
jgi:excinuclease ABC subunit A